MATGFTLSYKGDVRPLSDWGIVSPKLSFVSQGIDTLTFGVAGENINDAPSFAYGETIDLFCAGTRVFSGRVNQLPAVGKGSSDRNQYTIVGPWWDLENIIFQQFRAVHINQSAPSSGLTPFQCSDVVLFQSYSGARMTNGEQAHDAIIFAYDNGANLAAGLIDAATSPPFEEGTDITCAEAVKRSIRWTPNSVTWVDYTASIPQLNLRVRGNLTPLTFDLSAGAQVIDWEIGPRYDLQARGCVIFEESVIAYADGTSGIKYDTFRASGYSGIGCIVMTIKLSEAETANNLGLSNLASDFYTALKDLQWSGSLTIREKSPTCSLKVGTVVNFGGGRAEWASMNAVVQKVDIDLVTFTTKATLGAPEQLSAQDFLTYARTNRSSPHGTGSPSERTGGTPSSGTPVTPEYREYVVCRDGKNVIEKIRVN